MLPESLTDVFPANGSLSEQSAVQLVEILETYMKQLDAGQAPSREEWISRHPELASQLEACLAGLEFIHGAGQAEPKHPQRLGDFRIGREIGRGGMGAVYEAEQLDSGRRVALKVLSHKLDSPEARARFIREGRLAEAKERLQACLSSSSA